MSYTQKQAKPPRIREARTFVDYDDLHRSLTRLTHNENASVKVISELIDALRDNVPEEEAPSRKHVHTVISHPSTGLEIRQKHAIYEGHRNPLCTECKPGQHDRTADWRRRHGIAAQPG